MTILLRVLIIEDLESDADLALMHLEKSGYQVASRRVETSLEMKEALDQSRWDIIISDFSLPNFSAPSALKVLQASGKDIPLIVVSGTISEETAIDLMRAGAADYLMKDRLARLGPLVKRELNIAQVRRERNETEERFQQFVERSNDFFYRQNFQTGQFEYVSPKAARVLGYEREEVLTWDLAEQRAKIHPDDRAGLDSFIQDLVEADGRGENHIEREYRLIDPRGEYQWIHGNYSLIRAENHQPLAIMGSLSNITARKQAEQALRDEELYFRAIVRTTRDGFCMLDARGGILDANQAYCDLTGYSLGELRQMGISDLEVMEEPAVTAARIQRIIQNGSELFETRQHRKDGSIFDAEISTTFMAEKGGQFICFCRDISGRKGTEETLHESEKRYRLLAENSSDVIWTVDNTLTFTYISPSIQSLRGLNVEEASHESIAQTMPQRSLEIVQQKIGPLREASAQGIHTGVAQFEIEQYRGDGSRVWVEMSIKRQLDDWGHPIGWIGVSRDIDERKRAEIDLAESQRLLNTMIDSTHDQIWSVDPQTFGLLSFNLGLRDFFMQWLNLSIEKGMRPEELFPTDEIIQRWKGFYRRALAEGAFSIEYKLSVGGIVMQLNFNLLKRDGAIIGIAVFSRDITERKQAEDSLRASEERFRTLVERFDLATRAAHLAVWDWDIPQDRLVWDARMYELYGIQKEDFPGAYDAWLNGLHPEDRSFSFQATQQALSGEKEYDTEFRVIWPDGTLHWIKAYGDVIRDENGSPLRMIGVNFDNTERKQAEDDLRRLNAELENRVRERTAQLELANQELEAFAYSVSHDLRAPLRAMNGFSTALLDDYSGQLDPRGVNYLSRIQDSARRMGHLIDALLSLSQVTRAEIKRQKVDLSRLAQSIAADLKTQAPQRPVEFEIAPDLIVDGDANLLKIALDNLLQNAHKFTSKRERAVIQIGALERDGKRIFFVRDNGAGFDMAYAKKLFTPFQRLHGGQEYSGSGIGLSIVQRIVTRHGGQIWPESEIERGSTFYFTLGKAAE